MNLRSIVLGHAALDRLMPMHVVITPTGHISRIGSTIAKMRQQEDLVGRRFFEVFEVQRSMTGASSRTDLNKLIGTKLHLTFRNGRRTGLKGVLVDIPGSDVLLLNLSFGISVVESVRDYALTNSDFAPTDLTVEMLYLFEAKSVVMQESRNLNLRLHQARLIAEERALTDTLTGLKNRRAMDQILSSLVVERMPFGLMHLDLDYFKAVNDTFGHAAGDQVLKFVSGVLLDETRSGDLVARVGGDEFVLIFDGLVDSERLMKIASRIVTRLEQPIQFEGELCQVSGSVGITTTEFYKVPDPDRMLSDADVALYASKHKGRARATLATAEVLKAGYF